MVEGVSVRESKQEKAYKIAILKAHLKFISVGEQNK